MHDKQTRHRTDATAALAIALAFALPAPLSAGECPTAADLATGITLSRDDMLLRTTYTAGDTAGALLETRLIEVDGREVTTATEYLHRLAVSVQDKPEGAVRLDYEDGLETLDLLGAGETARVPFIVRSVDGSETAGRLTVTRTDGGDVIFGDCTYPATAYLVDYEFMGKPTLHHAVLLSPDLGIPLAQYTLDDDGTPVMGLVYTAITAEGG